jgi:8-oxo-dGTP pyrophosphatase MutT (NUDIX family)
MEPGELAHIFSTITPCHADRAPGSTPTVVFLLFFRPQDWQILTIQKTNTAGYPWANQIALPGGHIDAGDASPLAAAFRELQEETGIEASEVDLFGSIGHFATIANKDIEGFAGYWKHPRPLQIATTEISRVLELPLREALQEHRARGYAGRRPPVEELAYTIDDTRIWGATARIIHCVCEHLLTQDQ